jgi:hypothetical protein
MSDPLPVVLDQLHEPIVHVQLLVTVPQSVSRIVGDEIDFHGVEGHYIDYVLH